MIHQPILRGLAVFADAWLSGWLAEISADLREVVAHYRHFATMQYINPCTLLLIAELVPSITPETASFASINRSSAVMIL